MKIKKFFKILALSISTIAFILFSLLWWERKSMPYNEVGRYYDGFVIWHEQGVILYALLYIFSFVAVVATGYFYVLSGYVFMVDFFFCYF